MGAKMELMDDGVMVQRGPDRSKIVAIAVIILGVVLLIVGIALIAVSASKQCSSSEAATSQPQASSCAFSAEANRVTLGEFLEEVKDIFYKLHPFKIQYHPEVELFDERVRNTYTAYDPTPAAIKKRTDAALDLYAKISGAEVNTDQLKPRERKALAQVQHYLKHIFGQPYDVNYYAGDWMLGPNLFCWQSICYQSYDIYNAMRSHKPYSLDDIETLRRALESHLKANRQYIANMKLGVKTGMVRSVEECRAGIDSIKHSYLNIFLAGSPSGEQR